MSWLKLDDQRLGHDKLVEAGPMAELLDVRGMLYAAQRETDGFVPSRQLALISYGIPAPKRRAAELVRVGRWHEDSDGKGWWIHDFLDYNPSAADREAERKKARDRMAEVRARRGGSSPEQTPELQPQFEEKFAKSSDYPVPVPHTSTDVDGGEATVMGSLFEPENADPREDETYTRRLARWLADEHGLPVPDEYGSKADVHLWVLENAHRVGIKDEHSASMGVICNLIYALTGDKPTKKARDVVGRQVRDHGGLEVLQAMAESINSGAGLGEYADDEIALQRYTKAIIGNAKKRAS